LDAPIRHVSLDVWKTLIEPNPEFAKARTRYLVAELSLPEVKVLGAYRMVKDEADRLAEAYGLGLRSDQAYDRLLRVLNRSTADWWTLRAGLERLFAKYPPIVLPEVVEALRIAQARGFGLSIGSNTNFIRGEALGDIVLRNWGVAWDFEVFSDQIGRSKPADFFWKVVSERALAHTGAEPAEVLHVGDNPICDGGCRKAGIQFALIRGPQDIPALLESLNVAQAA
jgi:putative hydrolase of the HAD superfamily